MNRKTSYSLHIQPLFTASQRACMLGKFDLNKYEDVRQWAGKIASSLANKTMPADDAKPWPDEWIALFQRWIDEGCAP
jgi:hypothetical protein